MKKVRQVFVSEVTLLTVDALVLDELGPNSDALKVHWSPGRVVVGLTPAARSSLVCAASPPAGVPAWTDLVVEGLLDAVCSTSGLSEVATRRGLVCMLLRELDNLAGVTSAGPVELVWDRDAPSAVSLSSDFVLAHDERCARSGCVLDRAFAG